MYKPLHFNFKMALLAGAVAVAGVGGVLSFPEEVAGPRAGSGAEAGAGDLAYPARWEAPLKAGAFRLPLGFEKNTPQPGSPFDFVAHLPGRSVRLAPSRVE
ncbi:MAG: hypothetical protein ACRDIA_06665, partial [Actinomycetota bacterium]